MTTIETTTTKAKAATKAATRNASVEPSSNPGMVKITLKIRGGRRSSMSAIITDSFNAAKKAGHLADKCHQLPIDTPAKLALLWNQEIDPLKPDSPPGMEAMAAVYLDEDSCLIDWTILGVGILGVSADVRVIIAEGSKLKARAFALIHNHPPGYSLAPSKEDLETVRFLEAEVATDNFRLRDSIIINAVGWRSIKQDRWAHWGNNGGGHRLAKKGGRS